MPFCKLTRVARRRFRGGRKLLSGFALAASAAAASAQTTLPPPPDAQPHGGWAAVGATPQAPAAPGEQWCGPQADVHPVTRRRVSGPHEYLPRTNIFAGLQKHGSLYGSLEYLNLRIEEPESLIGNRSFNPFDDGSDPTVVNTGLNGGVILDPPDPTTIIVPGLNTGRLDLTEPIFISPSPLATEISDVDIVAANPFFFPLDAVGGAAVVPNFDSPNALLLIPNTFGNDHENVPGIRGMVGYRWSSGLAFEASVFGTQNEASDLSFVLDGDLSTPDIIEPDPSFDFDLDDNFDGDGGAPDIFDPNNGGAPLGVDPDDQRRRRIALIPVRVSDAVLGLDDAGAEVIGDRVIPLFYDNNFTASYQTDLIGTDGQLYVPVRKGDPRLSFDLSVGARYLNLDERMSASATQQLPIFETFDASGAAIAVDRFPFGVGTVDSPRTTFIGSDVENHLYAAQLGFRSELDLAPFTLGVTPRFGLGGNSYNATVTTANLFRGPNPALLEDEDALTFTRRDSGTNLSAMLDLNVYAKWQLREWLRVNVGYTLLMADGVQRAPDAVDYSASFSNPALGVRKRDSKIVVDGLTLGFEVLLP